MKRLQTFCYAVAALGATALTVAVAAEQTIHQKGRTFSADAVTVKKGEKLVFLNDDSIPHNIMSTSKGNEFNLGSVAPGTAIPVAFDNTGAVAVICAIHPRMKMSVTVTE